MSQRTPRRNFSPERKSLYNKGLVLQLGGGLGFLVCFLGFAFGGKRAVDTMGSEGQPMTWWVGAVVCMVIIVVGAFMRRIAARGIAGSGLVLDAERAREDLEPWARMGGGMVKDALDEAGLAGGNAAEGPVHAASPGAEPGRAGVGRTVTAVKCGHCHTLNDSDAKFCDECGSQL